MHGHNIGVSQLYRTVWLSDKTTICSIGTEPYEGYTKASASMSNWVAGSPVVQSPMTFERYFNTHSLSFDVLYLKKGKYPDENIATDIVFEGFSESYKATAEETLDRTMPPTSVISKLSDDPFSIACYLKIKNNCVISRKPYCAVSNINDERVNVEVFFPADLFANNVDLDEIGWARLRVQLQAFSSDGVLQGIPIDASGLLLPIGDYPPQPSYSPTWWCQRAAEVVSLFSVIGVPLGTHFGFAAQNAIREYAQG